MILRSPILKGCDFLSFYDKNLYKKLVCFVLVFFISFSFLAPPPKRVEAFALTGVTVLGVAVSVEVIEAIVCTALAAGVYFAGKHAAQSFAETVLSNMSLEQLLNLIEKVETGVTTVTNVYDDTTAYWLDGGLVNDVSSIFNSLFQTGNTIVDLNGISHEITLSPGYVSGNASEELMMKLLTDVLISMGCDYETLNGYHNGLMLSFKYDGYIKVYSGIAYEGGMGWDKGLLLFHFPDVAVNKFIYNGIDCISLTQDYASVVVTMYWLNRKVATSMSASRASKIIPFVMDELCFELYYDPNATMDDVLISPSTLNVGENAYNLDLRNAITDDLTTYLDDLWLQLGEQDKIVIADEKQGIIIDMPTALEEGLVGPGAIEKPEYYNPPIYKPPIYKPGVDEDLILKPGLDPGLIAPPIDIPIYEGDGILDIFKNFWERMANLFKSLLEFLVWCIFGDFQFDFDSLKINGSMILTKFPFCVPYDLYLCFESLLGSASAPVITFDFRSLDLVKKLQSAGADMSGFLIQIDFSDEKYTKMYKVFRVGEYGVFLVSLIVVTRSIIRG